MRRLALGLLVRPLLNAVRWASMVFGWLRGKQFPLPQAPLRDYWLTVHVRFHQPVTVDGSPPAVGYLRVLGVRCTPLRLRSLVEDNETDGSVLWSESESTPVDLNNLDRSLRQQLEPKDGECVWHRTGRILFPAER